MRWGLAPTACVMFHVEQCAGPASSRCTGGLNARLVPLPAPGGDRGRSSRRRPAGTGDVPRGTSHAPTAASGRVVLARPEAKCLGVVDQGARELFHVEHSRPADRSADVPRGTSGSGMRRARYRCRPGEPRTPHGGWALHTMFHVEHLHDARAMGRSCPDCSTWNIGARWGPACRRGRPAACGPTPPRSLWGGGRHSRTRAALILTGATGRSALSSLVSALEIRSTTSRPSITVPYTT